MTGIQIFFAVQVIFNIAFAWFYMDLVRRIDITQDALIALFEAIDKAKEKHNAGN